MEPKKDWICFNCVNNDPLTGCKAFPDGIPEVIIKGDNKHKTPFPEQGNDLVHEPIVKK